MTSDNVIMKIEDDNYSVDLRFLSVVNYPFLQFNDLTDFSISQMIYRGETVTLFSGHFLKQKAIIETCNRVPFKLVCREINILNKLSKVNGVVNVLGFTKNSSLGIVTLAYKYIEITPYTIAIPQDKLLRLFESLVSIVAKLHKNRIVHHWICKSSVYVDKSFSNITLGCFHAAHIIGEPAPLVIHTQYCPRKAFSDETKTDLYMCAMWYLSYRADDKIENPLDLINSLDLDSRLEDVLKDMISGSSNITAEKVVNAISLL